MNGDPVTVTAAGRVHATVVLDVSPSELTSWGAVRVRELAEAAIGAVVTFTRTGVIAELDRSDAHVLAASLRRVAFDPDSVCEVPS